MIAAGLSELEVTSSRPRRLGNVRGPVVSLFRSISRCLFPSAPASVSGEELELGRGGRPSAPPPVSAATATPGDRPGGGGVVSQQPEAKIAELPDEVLLDIFDFCRAEFEAFPLAFSGWKWQTLTHVCRRWRHVVLASPRRLDLRIACNARTPTRESLDVWPPFPISVTHDCWESIPLDAQGEENIIAALEQSHRVYEVALFGLTNTVLERFAAAMRGPFPALTHFSLYSLDVTPMALPETFLGGSTPRLRSFALRGLPFPSLPNFVSSASHLQLLHLYNISRAGYISPQAMVAFLPSLSVLQHLVLDFQDLQSRPIQMTPPPSIRAVLPALTRFQFSGVGEYLDDFVARVDTPLLNNLRITLFLDGVLDTPQLQRFIDRAERLRPLNQAEIKISFQRIQVVLGSPTGRPDALKLDIIFYALGWEVIVQTCNQFSTFLSKVEQLFISEIPHDEAGWHGDIDNIPWLEVLLPFVSAKSLRVTEKLGPHIAAALQELTEVTEVLPALHDVYLENLQPSGSLWQAMRPFVSARQSSDHPVVVQRWERIPES